MRALYHAAPAEPPHQAHRRSGGRETRPELEVHEEHAEEREAPEDIEGVDPVRRAGGPGGFVLPPSKGAGLAVGASLIAPLSYQVGCYSAVPPGVALL
jgi:hypothetical protein